MDPVQALILKLMESRAGQDRAALNPSSPQPGQAQAPIDDFSAYAGHLGPSGTGPGMSEFQGAQSPEDLIAAMLSGQGNLPQR